MDWERRDDGELKLVVLRDAEIDVAEGEALACASSTPSSSSESSAPPWPNQTSLARTSGSHGRVRAASLVKGSQL